MDYLSKKKYEIKIVVFIENVHATSFFRVFKIVVTLMTISFLLNYLKYFYIEKKNLFFNLEIQF